jgi:uncharacterized membrane protein YeaQ/YmgE (transglycosylase-associated protein family)
MGSIISWIVIGFVAGALARSVTRVRWPSGCLGTIVIGILGGLLGGIIFNLAGDKGITHFGLWAIFVAFIGACALLLVVGLVSPRARR